MELMLLHVFSMHSTLLDKQLFITRLLNSDILSECIRRPTSVDRYPTARPILCVKCSIPVALDKETLCHLRPLPFKSSSKRSKVTSPTGTDTTTASRAYDANSPMSPDAAMYRMTQEFDILRIKSIQISKLIEVSKVCRNLFWFS